MAGPAKRAYLRDVNPHLICPLCRGYLIDATTVVECLHSFCRSCILKHLRKDAQCPSCKHLLNTAKPNIKADKALQDIVYKLVPGLYHKEMRKRREFYSKHPEAGFAVSLNHLGGADSATPEQRGEDVTGRLIFAPEDAISLSLEYLPVGADPLALLASNSDTEPTIGKQQKVNGTNGNVANRRYLQCPALVTIAHLKKFLGLKYSVDMTRYNIDICHRRAPLPEHWTLMDVAYIFAWKRNAPIRFFYRITQEEQRLEAPPNDRPSTPGLGASQPATNESATQPEPDQREADTKTATVKTMDASKKPSEKVPDSARSGAKPAQTAREEKPQEPVGKSSKSKESGKKSPSASPPDSSMKQVKSPIKIMKNPDGRYQVLRSPSLPKSNSTSPESRHVTPKSSPPAPRPTTPEFSVVSIADGANSNGVRIKLKQCSPGTNSNSSSSSSTSSSKKPKVISNVLLRNSTQGEKVSASSIVEQMHQDLQKQEKQKRKQVTFMDVDSTGTTPTTTPTKQPPKKAPVEQTDKKQFLHSFKLTAKQGSLEKSKPLDKDEVSVEEQVRNILKNSEAKKEMMMKGQDTSPTKKSQESSPTKKRQSELKIASTNIGERLSGVKQSASSDDSNSSQTISSSSSNNEAAQQQTQQQQQPIDVYAFPNDPPAIVPAGAVKRKCPPGVPIYEIRKRQHQQAQQQQSAQPQQQPQPQYQIGKRAGVNAARGGAVKCYRNQTKPSVYAKPPPSPARPPQNMPNPLSNAANVNASTPPSSQPNSAVSSTSARPNTVGSPSVMMSHDTRNLLDGCGLNIPASLSITLTAPRSPSCGSDPPLEIRNVKDSNQDKLNPSITLNDKSVDPRVLKALKAGQMRMPPPAPAAGKATKRQHTGEQQQQGAVGKRKKEETSSTQQQQQQQQQQQGRNILDLSGTKKMDLHPLRIPTPLGKAKSKLPPTWSQANNSKPSGKDDVPTYTTANNNQVITLNGGQRFYRAPPGSLTPAAHRINDIPTPSRAPVYAPCFSSPSPAGGRSPANLSSVFPSLQSIYALSQAPSLEQFHMDSRIRAVAAVAAAANKDGNGSANASSSQSGNGSGQQMGKSHLAAQCAPVKPARSSGSFAVPIAKTIPGLSIRLANVSARNTAAPVATAGDSSTDSKATTQKERKSENAKEAPSKPDYEQMETCASTTEESNSQQDAASPRVTSTASPSPPPNAGSEATSTEKTPPATSKPEKRPPSSTSEVTSSNNKSPESPDSSSAVVTESTSNLVDSTKPAMTNSSSNSSKPTPKNAESKNEEQPAGDAKPSGNIDPAEFKKPMSSEALQKRFLAAFPSNEWANNPVAAEQFGNFLKSLSTMQAEAQSKNTKTAE